MESVISNGTLFYDGVPKWTRRKEKKENFSLRPTTTYTVRLRLTTSTSLTHSKLPQTLCLRASPLLGHRLRRLLPAVVGGYVLKQQFHGSNFNTETQRLRVFWETYFATLVFFAATPTSKLKTLNSLTPPKIFRNEFSKHRNQNKTLEVHSQTAIFLHPHEGLAS